MVFRENAKSITKQADKIEKGYQTEGNQWKALRVV